MQIVATNASTHFYSQETVDEAVKTALAGLEPSTSTANGHDREIGVKVWRDADEWSVRGGLSTSLSACLPTGLDEAWRPDTAHRSELHICRLVSSSHQLRRWADLVVVAPCSADMLAKIAGGLCDNLAVCLV